MKKLFTAASLLLAAGVWSLPAGARDVGDPVVAYLRDGTTVRGTLVAVAPGDKCEIALEGGGTASIPWDDLVRIVTPVAPAPAEAPSAPPPRPAVMLPDPDEDTVFVEIESSSVVQLQRRASNGTWEHVCSSPCGEPVPVLGTYRIVHHGTKLDDISFRPNQAGTRVRLHAYTRSAGLTAGGITAAIIGGLVMTGAAAADDGDTRLRAGIVGAAIAALGTTMLIANRSGVREAPPSFAPPRTSGSSERRSPGAPSAFLTPVFSLRF